MARCCFCGRSRSALGCCFRLELLVPFVPFMTVALKKVFEDALKVLEFAGGQNAECAGISRLESAILSGYRRLVRLVYVRLAKDLDAAVPEKHVNEWCLNRARTALVIQQTASRWLQLRVRSE